MIRAETCAGLVSNLRRSIFSLRHRVRRPMPGCFQPYHHTLPDRYPWLFGFATTVLGSLAEILKQGAETGPFFGAAPASITFQIESSNFRKSL